jgi:hypothetical protein
MPNTVPVKFKGTSFINFMTGVPSLIINDIPLNLNGRNGKITGVPLVQLQL